MGRKHNNSCQSLAKFYSTPTLRKEFSSSAGFSEVKPNTKKRNSLEKSSEPKENQIMLEKPK